MAQETIVSVKRTIWVAKCPGCQDRTEFTENAPKERFCFKCKTWVPYVEESYTGPSLDKSKNQWP